MAEGSSISYHPMFKPYYFQFKKFLDAAILQSHGNGIFCHFTGIWLKDMPAVLKVSQHVHTISSLALLLILISCFVFIT